MGVEALLPETPIKTFDLGVIGRLAGPAEIQPHATLMGPLVHHLGK